MTGIDNLFRILRCEYALARMPLLALDVVMIEHLPPRSTLRRRYRQALMALDRLAGHLLDDPVARDRADDLKVVLAVDRRNRDAFEIADVVGLRPADRRKRCAGSRAPTRPREPE